MRNKRRMGRYYMTIKRKHELLSNSIEKITEK